jgi:hypothetical protein
MTNPFCAGITAYDGLCAKHAQCALYRLWWEEPRTDMKLCAHDKFDRFVPSVIGPAAPAAVTATPIGKTMELFE